MKRARPIRWPRVLLVSLLVGFAMSCSENNGDGGTGPGTVSNPDVASAATAMNGMVTTFFAPNEDNLGALATFGALFAGALSAPPAPAFRAEPELSAVVTSCFTTAGTTYEFDDAQGIYVAGVRLGAPADGVRFIIYELDGVGQPVVPLVEIGHVDLVCTYETPGNFALSLALVVDGVTVFSLSTPSALISPTLATADFDVILQNLAGTQQLMGGAQITRNTEQESLGLSVDVTPTLQAGFVVTESTAGEGQIYSAVVGGTATLLDFTIDLSADFDAAGNLAGEITYNDFMGLDLIACVSGTLDAPAIANAVTAGCTVTGAVPVSLSAIQLLSVSAAYQGLGGAHDVLGTIIDQMIDAVLTLAS